MSDKTPEQASIYGANDPESVTCICGNAASIDGFMQTDANGKPMYLNLTGAPEGLVNIPEGDDTYFVCYRCGRGYSDTEIKTHNTATVVFRRDVDSPEFQRDVDVYQANL